MNIDIQTRRFRLLDWIKFISTFLKVDSHGNLTNLLCVGFEAFEAAANLTASEFTTTYNASVLRIGSWSKSESIELFYVRVFKPVSIRVARWHIFKPKIPIWVNFGGSRKGRCWYILWPIGLFYVHLVYSVSIWYMLWLFGIFFPFWYVVPRKIWLPWSYVSVRRVRWTLAQRLPDLSWYNIPKR
jgi:hypothetical protein